MGGTQVRCCSVRDKQDRLSPSPNKAPQFKVSNLEVTLPSPRFVAFAPLWHREGLPVRRMALANESLVHVYKFLDPPGADMPKYQHEFTLDLQKYVITALCFAEETHSRSVAVAFGPAPGAPVSPRNGSRSPRSPRRQHTVRVWSCERGNGTPQPSPEPETEVPDSEGPIQWSLNNGFVASLEGHVAPVHRLAVSPSFLLSADDSGGCCVWQKNRNFSRRMAQILHEGGIADVAIDRLFVYTAGLSDRSVKAWSMPDLAQIFSVSMTAVEACLTNISAQDNAAMQAEYELKARRECCGSSQQISMPAPVPAPQSGPGKAAPRPPATPRCRISKLTAIKLPLSRWAGTQGSSSRSAKAPRGSLFFAGTLGDFAPNNAGGAGVVVQYQLAEELVCRSAQIGHDSPVTAMAYGPYDNGPLITADSQGHFRVWDIVPRLTMTQRFSFEPEPGDELGRVCVCVEPQVGLYVTVGDRRLFCLRRANQLEDR